MEPHHFNTPQTTRHGRQAINQKPTSRPPADQWASSREQRAVTLMRPHQRPHTPASHRLKSSLTPCWTHTLVRVDQKPRSSQAHPSSPPTQSRIPTTLAGKLPGQGRQQHTTTCGTIHDATRAANDNNNRVGTGPTLGMPSTRHSKAHHKTGTRPDR